MNCIKELLTVGRVDLNTGSQNLSVEVRRLIGQKTKCTKNIFQQLLQTWTSLSTVTTVTSWDIRKIVNKEFIVTIDNFDVGGVASVIGVIVKVDGAVDLALARSWMSSGKAAVDMSPTSPSFPVSLRRQLGSSFSDHAVPPRPLPIQWRTRMAFLIATESVALRTVSGIVEVSRGRVQLVVVETLFREMWTRWARFFLHLLVPRVVQVNVFQPSSHLCTLSTLQVGAIGQADSPASLP